MRYTLNLYHLLALSLLVYLTYAGNLYAKEEKEEAPVSTYQEVKQHLCSIWQEGRYQALLPIHTYHTPRTYNSEKRKDYNERPWGFGIGKYIQPTPNRRYGLSAMTFQDSFNKPEPTFFYSWQHLFLADKDFRPHIGFAAGITFRDNYHWIPVPGAAPTIGFDYKSFSVNTLYVPGFDVFLTWMSWYF